MRRVREFTAFEALVHTVVKRLGFCLSGVGKSIGFGTSAVTAALSSGATTSRSGACSATRRRIIATLFRYGATPEEREALLLSLYLSFRRAVLNDATVLCGLLIKEMEKK